MDLHKPASTLIVDENYGFSYLKFSRIILRVWVVFLNAASSKEIALFLLDDPVKSSLKPREKQWKQYKLWFNEETKKIIWKKRKYKIKKSRLYENEPLKIDKNRHFEKLCEITPNRSFQCFPESD